MAFKNFLSLFSVTAVLALAQSALAEEPEKEQQNIPELPAKEGKMLGPEENDQVTLVTYEQPRLSGFFTDNRYTKGPARTLNALELNGYMRLGFNYFRNGSLLTYVPELGKGTSLMLPDASIYNIAENENKSVEKNPAQNQFSGVMRLRLDPTINVAETVRIKGTIDVFDNMILGSTPSYLTHGPAFMSTSQSSVNSFANAINVKRVWAEASFAIGDLRFGRMPYHWGLGILHNSGDDISSNYGDQVDGIFFSTRIGDHYLTPGYSIAYAGPSGRAPGIFSNQFHAANYLLSEPGLRYPLETGDLTHVLSLSLLKRDSDFIVSKKTEEGRAVFNYGALASYRRQTYDSKDASPNDNLEQLAAKLKRRESNVGELSLWTEIIYDTFHLEMEAAGIWGQYQDVLATSLTDKKNTWILRGGFALESRYGFLDDRLQIGLDAGIASSEPGEGFGIRDDSKYLDSDRYRSTFQFNPAYNIDLLLHKEVLGGVSGTAYFKPHIAYFFSRNLGIRGDVITALAPTKSNTPGNSNWLGTEIDASAFLRTETGFYFQLAYGLLFPLKGLDHVQGLNDAQKQHYGSAKIAQTIQTFFGVTF